MMGGEGRVKRKKERKKTPQTAQTEDNRVRRDAIAESFTTKLLEGVLPVGHGVYA